MTTTFRKFARKTAALLPLLLVLAASLLATGACGGGPDSGFFIGGGAHVLYVPGTGSWDDMDFDIQESLSDEPGSTIGFFWADNFLLGVKPLVGYRVNPNLAFQASYGFNIPKSTQQVYSESTVNAYYEQGMQVDWAQHSMELVGVFQPLEQGDFFVFAGVDLCRVNMDVTLFEGVETDNLFGDVITDSQIQKFKDHLSAVGLVFGLGLEFPTQSEFVEYYLSARYSTTRSQGAFFGTPDFEVDVGGLAVTVGMRLYPF